MSEDKEVSNYRKRLLSAQKWAQHNRYGHWHFAKRPTLSWKVQQSLTRKVKSILPRFMVQHLNI